MLVGPGCSSAHPTQQEHVKDGDDGKWNDYSEDQLDVHPDLPVKEVIIAGPFDRAHDLLTFFDGPTEQPIGERQGKTEDPDGHAQSHTYPDLPKTSHCSVGGQVAVNTESHQSEEAGVLIALAENGDHLAGQLPEDPVTSEGHEREEGQREDKEFVCEGQVPDIVVAYGAGPDLVVFGDDVDDETVTNDAEDERYHVEGQGDDLDVNRRCPV